MHIDDAMHPLPAMVCPAFAAKIIYSKELFRPAPSYYQIILNASRQELLYLKLYHVPVFDHVFFAFGAKEAFFSGGGI